MSLICLCLLFVCLYVDDLYQEEYAPEYQQGGGAEYEYDDYRKNTELYSFTAKYIL